MSTGQRISPNNRNLSEIGGFKDKKLRQRYADNVMFDAAAGTTALVDWEDAAQGPLVFDVGPTSAVRLDTTLAPPVAHVSVTN